LTTGVYVGLWLTPEPSGITKLAAGTLTVILLTQFTWHDLYGFAKAWDAFYDDCARAKTGNELKKAGERFLAEAGPRVFDIMLAIVLWGLGKGAGKLGKVKVRTSAGDETAAETTSERTETRETASEFEVEPSRVVAKEGTADGHEIRVTGKGEVLFCSICKPLRVEYAEELADPVNKAFLNELDAADPMVDAEAKAKVEARIRNRLEAVRKITQSRYLSERNLQIKDPTNPGRIITDIDKFGPNKLIEEKSATKAINKVTGADETPAWIQENITAKFARYLEARNYISGFRNAAIEFDFTQPGVDPVFRSAVEAEVGKLRIAHPDVNIVLKWR